MITENLRKPYAKYLPICRVRLKMINEQEVSQDRRGIRADDQVHTGDEGNVGTQANIARCDIYACETV